MLEPCSDVALLKSVKLRLTLRKTGVPVSDRCRINLASMQDFQLPNFGSCHCLERTVTGDAFVLRTSESLFY